MKIVEQGVEQPNMSVPQASGDWTKRMFEKGNC